MEPPRALPPESLEETLSRSTAVVVGTLEAGEPHWELDVTQTLAGPVPVGRMAVHSVELVAGVHSGDTGTWMLSGEPGNWVLEAGGANSWSEREIRRVLMGLPRVDSPPSGSALAELIEAADLIAYGDVTSEDGIAGTFHGLMTLKGDAKLVKDITVTAPKATASNELPWRWYIGTAPATLLLERTDGAGWRVLNPSDPYLYTPGLMQECGVSGECP